MRPLRLFALALLTALIAALGLPRSASANAGGFAGAQCNQCHFGGTIPTVSITADATCISAGASTTVHVAISNVNGGGGGVDIRLLSGTGSLSIGGPDMSGTILMGGEVVQNARKPAPAGGTIRFSAIFTATATIGSTVVQAYGLAANGDANTSGDGFAQTTMTITIVSPPVCLASQNCGNSPANACGNTISCGTCSGTDSCGGAGTPGQCGCTPTAACGVATCGPVPDGCGGSADCGKCSATQTCVSGTCVDGQGTACTAASGCATGFCVNGTCCDSACTGACQTCATGTCSNAPATQSCGAASCVGVTLTPASHCSGTDTTCVTGAGSACPDHLVCGTSTSCKSSCTSDADCVGSTCNTTTGTCAGSGTGDSGTQGDAGPPSVVGSATHCSAASQCASGFCVDGVCCDSACTDPCHTCALPSSPGVCIAEPLGVDLDHECGAALTCLGTCDGVGACTGAGPGTECDHNKCTGASSGVSAVYCKAAGATCSVDQAVAFDCGAYACDPAFGACKSLCNTSDDCASGATCDPGSKSCVPSATASSSGCGCEVVGEGRIAWGALALFAGAFVIGATRRRRRQ